MTDKYLTVVDSNGRVLVDQQVVTHFETQVHTTQEPDPNNHGGLRLVSGDGFMTAIVEAE